MDLHGICVSLHGVRTDSVQSVQIRVDYMGECKVLLRWQGIWALLQQVKVFEPPIGGLVYHLLCHNTFKAVLSASSSRYELSLNAPLLF